MIIIAIILSIFFEATITTLPFTLMVLFFVSVTTRRSEVFLLSLVSGVILDMLAFRMIGISAIYFVSFIFLVILYQKKFELESLPFVGVFSLIGSLGYLFLIGAKGMILQSVLISFIVVISFSVFQISNKKFVKA